MNFEIIPAHELPVAEQVKIFNDAFAGYVAGSVQMDAGGLAAFLCGHGVDQCYSRFVRDEIGALVSFGFINRTGNITRLAGMGTVPAGRRLGAGRFLMSHLLNEAKARGDATMVLEVIEQNAPAVALYRSCDFREVSRLFGWRSNGDTTRSAPSEFREIPVTQALGVATPLDYPELPWQMSRHAAAKASATRAFAAEGVAVVIGAQNEGPARIHAFLGCDGQNWKPLRSLTSSLLAKFPGQAFFAPAIYPEQFGLEIFQPLKFQKQPLSQFLMRRDL
jgi:ribosomal protein S18 acetylase RimI-like enzyme